MKIAVKQIERSILSLSPLAELNCERTYSVSSITLFFFMFSGVGWIWEVVLHIIEDGMFINRGVMTGPWLPIYGFGGILVLTLLKKWRLHPAKTFGFIILLCGVLEYGTSCVLETLFGAMWWDYSDMIFNLHGRICLEGLLIFGIGGLIFIYIIAPSTDNLFAKCAEKTKRIICVILSCLFIFDLVYSSISPNMGFGITS